MLISLADECQATMWTVLEANIAIICACLPLSRVLLATLFPRIFSLSSTSRTGDAGPYGNFSKQRQDRSNNNNTGLVTSVIKSNLQSSSLGSGRKDSGEEYILQDKSDQAATEEENTGIRKIMQFSVEYDDDLSRE